ncbi:MAG: ketosteroid isomerase-related protein [Methylococcales bacterium]|nr:ketosteroid isomerase-related protein [Methylococcales bacterium]
MTQANTIALIERYYNAFNNGDMNTFLSLLSEDVIHDINQGERQIGKAAFQTFMDKMNRHYREQLVDFVIMASADGRRAAAEFVVLGEYLHTDEGLPEANGQTYRLPVGAFFDVDNHHITRISNYYNLENWIQQVNG